MIEEMKKELRVLLHKLQFDYYDHGVNMHTIIPDSDIKNIMEFVESKLKSEIAEACRQQREICAEYYIDQSLEKSWGARDIIINAPSPKESDNER